MYFDKNVSPSYHQPKSSPYSFAVILHPIHKLISITIEKFAYSLISCHICIILLYITLFIQHGFEIPPPLFVMHQ